MILKEPAQIIEDLRKGKSVKRSDFENLEKESDFLVLAQALEERYQFTRNPWTLAKACSLFRKANKPILAVEAADKLIFPVPEKFEDGLIAVNNSKSAAKRDIDVFKQQNQLRRNNKPKPSGRNQKRKNTSHHKTAVVNHPPRKTLTFEEELEQTKKSAYLQGNWQIYDDVNAALEKYREDLLK